MARMGRPGLTDGQKAELWRRWKEGQTLSEIGLTLSKQAASIFGVVTAKGGIAPAPRRRSSRTLNSSEREEISRGIAAGVAIRGIAWKLGRHASTISREIGRHGGISRYRASQADQATWDRALRPKACLLATQPRLRAVVAQKLLQKWSPEQIAGWLEKQYPDDQTMRVSHETIYRSLFIQARGVLKRELMAHLRTRRLMRHSKKATTKGQPRGAIADAISIRERPPEVEDRAIPGHWEGDLISGSQNSHIATLVERQSRFTVLVKVAGKDTQSVVSALTHKVLTLPSQLRQSLTWDRGGEMALHKDFTVATDVDVYFCDPQSPWQRGTNENTNGLLRQYFPDGTDLSAFSQRDLDRVAMQLNQRPRKTLGFTTPADKLSATVASTL